MIRPTRIAAQLTLVLLAVAGALLLIASGSRARPTRVTIQTRALAPAGARRLGPLARSATVRGAVVLKPRSDSALQSFIAAVTDPSSSAFHRYLPAGAFAQRFGPTAATQGSVRAALSADGLAVGPTSRDGLVIPFSGDAIAVQRTFATRLSRYQLADGTRVSAPTASISLPSSVAGDVATVLGLNGLIHEHRIGATLPSASAAGGRDHAATADAAAPAPGPKACADAQHAATQTGGLTDAAIAHAYGADGLYSAHDTGAGQRVAVYELEPFLRSDIRTFDRCYFGAARANQMMQRLHLRAVDGGQPRGPGSGEASLDVEDISALAPGAQIDVYAGPAPNANPNIYDAFDEYAAIVDDDRDQVVTSSWGLCEQALQHGQQGLQESENYLFQQAAAQGQTVFSAAGDNGSDDCNTRETARPIAGQNPVSVDDPSSQPYVVGVGGSAIDAAGSPPLEHVWNDGPKGGAGGGGISESWRMPAWQQRAKLPGIVRPGSATYRAANRIERAAGYAPNFCQAHAPGAGASTPCRLDPDVSAQADEYTGAITVYSHEYTSRLFPTGWTTTGGTSSAAPIWAATLALVNASPSCRSSRATARGVGFVSPLLYRLASNPTAYGASFTDIRTGNNDVYGISNGKVFAATRGYDLATGLGSPRLTDGAGKAGLAYYLCSIGASHDGPTVTRLRPSSGSTTGGERIRVTGSGFSKHGRSLVKAVQIGARPVPSNAVRVSGPRTLTVRIPPAAQGLPPSAHAAAAAAGPAQVIVTLSDGHSSVPGPRSRFTYMIGNSSATTPSVAAITPDGGLSTRSGTITVLGAGFTRVRRVTVGGVPAPRFKVAGTGRIRITYPRLSRRTACVKLPRGGVYAGDSSRNDICQVQVRVYTRAGVSAGTVIRPPLEGSLHTNVQGVLRADGCRCEVTQTSDEFDYLPRPRITSVSTSGGPRTLASEKGGSVITVKGVGLNPLDIDWANFGNPASDASVRLGYVYLSGTEMQIRAPRHDVTLGIARTRSSVRTLAGQSNARTVRYAGLPITTAVSTPGNRVRVDGLPGAQDTGGTRINISGLHFRGQVIALEILGLNAPSASSGGTQYRFKVTGDSTLQTQTVAQNPGLVAVEPCTVSGCARGSAKAGLLLYAPGRPTVTGVSPASGPAAGATAIKITGRNLGCALAVGVGAGAATDLQPVQTFTGCGSTTTLKAVTPAGTAGSSVPVTVRTAQSVFTHRAGTSSARFSYR